MQGRPAPLISSFKLSYYTLLNLLRRLEGSGEPSGRESAHSARSRQPGRHVRQWPDGAPGLCSDLAHAGCSCVASCALPVPCCAMLCHAVLCCAGANMEYVISKSFSQVRA